MSSYTDAAVTQLRSIVAVIDQEILQRPPSAALREAWAKLVDVMALGPAPQTRECPTCHGVGMRAATRCGSCWAALERLPPFAGEASP
jgi:hypothetical protein